MGRKLDKQPFLFVGNHLCLDFINTQMIVRGQKTDLLEEWTDLIAWLVRAKLLSVGEGKEVTARLSRAEGERLLGEARAFRATLREMAEGIVADKPVSRSTVEAINALLGQCQGYPKLVRTNGRFERRFHSETPGAARLLVPIAEAASELLCVGDLSLVKKCRNDACILYFYDTTKNHARQWCSMGLCGNRIKV
ncbi:MAG: ABATE domain-containing protein, partial [Nitrospirae bacterium]|nr:ABATE domain-containing protein [Nitrospirota bacterium]